MKRMRRPPPTAWAKFRPFLLPAIAVMVVVMMMLGEGFDVDAMREHFRRGHVEAALASLAAADSGKLPPSLRDVTFYDNGRRARELQALAQMPPEELLESPNHVTIVSPIQKRIDSPVEIVLRDATTEPLTYELMHVGLNMLAESGEVPVGSVRWPITASLLPGGTYTIALSRPSESDTEREYIAIAAFELIAPNVVESIDTALATARTLADDDRSAKLLEAQVALHFGLYEQAADLLESLEQFPAYVRIARELRAIALGAVGLDVTARKLAGTIGG